jgi:hypothetical protein
MEPDIGFLYYVKVDLEANGNTWTFQDEGPGWDLQEKAEEFAAAINAAHPTVRAWVHTEPWEARTWSKERPEEPPTEA